MQLYGIKRRVNKTTVMKETLDISLYLSLNYTDYHPQYKIYLDGQEINLGTALSRPRIPFEKKFSIEVESGKHTITFDAVNNESSITLFNIVINKFKCNTNNLMLKNCRFVSASGEVNPIKNVPCILHKSGRFEFEFESPFAYWALEQL